MMTKLSVNINKIAVLRNSRGGDRPNVVQAAKDCERFGADGITVHPRPDERHITYQDVKDLKQVVSTEFNIEGNPNDKWMDLVMESKPDQATLVPDAPSAITSDSGWDTVANAGFLREKVEALKALGIRVSIFVNANLKMIDGAANVGADRIEFYTGPFAHQYENNPILAVKDYLPCVERAKTLGLGVNAGHDLNLDNLSFLKQQFVLLNEVSIGHALIADALYYGLENTIMMYKRKLA